MYKKFIRCGMYREKIDYFFKSEIFKHNETMDRSVTSYKFFLLGLNLLF